MVSFEIVFIQNNIDLILEQTVLMLSKHFKLIESSPKLIKSSHTELLLYRLSCILSVCKLLHIMYLYHLRLSFHPLTWISHPTILIWCWGHRLGTSLRSFLVLNILLPVVHWSLLRLLGIFILDPRCCVLIKIYYHLHFYNHQWLDFQGTTQSLGNHQSFMVLPLL